VAKAKNKASPSIRRLKPTAIHIPNISLMFNIYFFNSNYLHFILPLASAFIAVGFSQRFAIAQRLLALAPFFWITKHLKNVAKAKNVCLT
jgi:hypothetical protein